MILRKLRRFVSPPKCLELDSLSLKPENAVYLINTDPHHSPLYIIRQNGAGRGLFSLVSSVVCHLHLAARYGLTPFVDLSSQASEYMDEQFIQSDYLGRRNPWEFFFQPVFDLPVHPSEHASMVLGSASGFPDGYPRKMLISHVQELRDLVVRHIKPAHDLIAELKAAHDEMLSGHRVLGVHFRGQEQKTMPYHPLSPTLDQMFAAIDMAIKRHSFTRIFVASEDQDYVKAVLNRYHGMAVASPHFRTSAPLNAYRIYPRPMHKYLLGKEVLIDAFLLASCDGLVSSTSNVTEFARAYNNGKYVTDLVIDNGLNAANPRIAKHLWTVKQFLPERLGGFSAKAIQEFPDLAASTD